jgi:alpha-galactosidase
MDFGLWFEPERATEGTHFHREHPEWFAPCNTWGQEGYYHLNLAIREAQDYVIELVGGWIKRLDLRWSLWDYNFQPELFWNAVDPTLKVQFGYMEGLYRVLDTLMNEHPNWMLEQCAGGGKRTDIGIIKRAHTIWFSDQTFDQSMCRYMQARANRFLPGHLLNSSVAVQLAGGDSG